MRNYFVTKRTFDTGQETKGTLINYNSRVTTSYIPELYLRKRGW